MPSTTDTSADGPEWIAHDPAAPFGAAQVGAGSLDAAPGAPATSSVQAILGGSRLPTITELEEQLGARTGSSDGSPPSIADLVGPIGAALARHAALIDEPLSPVHRPDTVPTPVPTSVPSHLPSAGPSAESASEPPVEPPVETPVEPPVETHLEAQVAASSGPSSVAPEPHRAADGTSETPRPPTRRTSDRLLVEVPSGRDWDAEISRSAELSPLIERGFGGAGSSANDDIVRDPQGADLPPWGGVVTPAPATPDPWRHSAVARADLAADRDGTPTDVLGPFGEVLLPAVTPRDAAHGDTAAGDAVLGDLVLGDPARDDIGGGIGATPTPADGIAAVSGEVVDLLQVTGLTFENDPMAVPQRPMAEPVLARDPALAETSTPTPARTRRSRRESRRPVAGVVPRRRGIARRLLRFVLVAALLAGVVVGGYLAVEHFVLAKRWPVSLQPVSQFVQERTGLEFERAIVVEEVPRAEFDEIVSEVRLGVPFAVAESTVSDVMASSRALGLWSGDYDPAAAARVVGRAWPAVYDPVTKIVYVDADVTDSDRRKAYVSRELTIGLFDQVYRWSEQLETATGGERLAYRTQMEAEALRVASAWLRELEGKPVPPGEAPPTMKFPDVDDESWAAVPDSQEITIRVPLVSGAPLATGEVADLADVTTSDGALLFSTVSGTDPPNLGPIADRDVFASGLGPQGPQGAAFWLTVLQSREDPSDAVAAMRGVRADDSRTVLTDTDGDGTFDQVCVDARLRTAGRVGADLLLSSFERWAAMAPPQSETIATRASPTVVAIRACDPGTAATTATRSTAAFDTVWLAAMRSVEMAPSAPTDEG